MFKSLVLFVFAAQIIFFAEAERFLLRRSASISNSTSTVLSAAAISSGTSLLSVLGTTSSTSSSASSSTSTSIGSSSSTSSTASSRSSTLSTSSSLTLSSSLNASSLSSSLTRTSTSSYSTNASTTRDGPICTGCVLQADYLWTLSYTDAPLVTSSYVAGTITTINSTGTDSLFTTILLTNFDASATPTLPANQTDVHLTLTWTWYLAPDVTLTAPNTYVAYRGLKGGLDGPPLTIPPDLTSTPTVKPVAIRAEDAVCSQDVRPLNVFPPKEGNHQAFIYELTDTATHGVVTLPPPLISYLERLPGISRVFNGSNIATCTLGTAAGGPPLTTSLSPVPLESTIPASTAAPVSSAVFTVIEPSPTPTKTLITSYFATAPSVIHISASDIRSNPQEDTHLVTVAPASVASSSAKLITSDNPTSGPVISIENHPSLPPSSEKPASTPGVGEIIASLIHNNPSIFNNPPHTEGGNNPVITAAPISDSPLQSIVLGNTIVSVGRAQQSGGGIIINGATLTPGQVTTLNGVVISIPPGGSSVVVGGSAIAVNPANPTPNPMLTVGNSVITANPSGEFVIGTQTLQPGGSILTVDGTTLSLGFLGTIAVVNGVSQTLSGGPQMAGSPALIVGGQTVSAIVVDGTTEFVLGPGKTLTPGGVLTVSGTTFFLPSGATPAVVVINGLASTLAGAAIAPALVLTLNGQVFSATVQDGTTEYVLGPGMTLVPGGSAVTVSGTTFSLPLSASVVVINGHTSKIAPASVSATLTADTKSLSTGAGSIQTSTNSKSGRSDDSTSSNGSIMTISSLQAPGNFIASGIGISSSHNHAPAGRAIRWEGMIEGLLMGVAGWVLLMLQGVAI